jgi:glycosyltransferase involved in cell wall biosynthesis
MKRNRINLKRVIEKKIELRNEKTCFINRREKNKMDDLDKIRNRTTRLEKRTEIITPNKKINVLISAYDCAEYIEECLDSIATQTYKPEKILLGIDGCKKTLEKVSEIQKKYLNLEVYYSEENNGTYQMFNALMVLIPDDEYIQRFDADDVMHSDMLEKMSIYNLPAISRHNGVLFFKREKMNALGGFRNWKCSADTDMVFRMSLLIGGRVKIAPQYYFRREHDKQLTKHPSTNHQSDLRKSYMEIFENNRKSENPEIYVEPICSNIIRINYE